MRQCCILALTTLTISLAACSSAEQRKKEADARYAEERAQTIGEYKRCVVRAQGDRDSLETCDRLLKIIQ